MLYLVSGASGFIGRALCLLLMERGCRVRALLRHECAGPWHEQVLCDLSNDRVPKESCEGVDGIFHLAGIAHVRAQSREEEIMYERVNVGGVRLLLDAAAAAGVTRFVYFSSVKAAADPGEHCVDETWDLPPTDAYGRSKLSAEQLVLMRVGSGMHVSILRPTLVYGHGVKGNLRRMIDAVAAGRFPLLPDTSNRRSMVALSDLAEAARHEQPPVHGRALRSRRGGVAGHDSGRRQWTRLYRLGWRRLFHARHRFDHPHRTGEVPAILGDPTLAVERRRTFRRPVGADHGAPDAILVTRTRPALRVSLLPIRPLKTGAWLAATDRFLRGHR